MKIPASKVPAQMWADKAREHYGDLNEVEMEVLEYWEGSKQVYRVNNGLWDEMSIDEAEELPMSLLSRLPYDCLFIQHRETIEHSIIEDIGSGVIEREGYFCFRDGEGFHIAVLNSRVDVGEGSNHLSYFSAAASNNIIPMPITLDDYKSVGDCMADITMDMLERIESVKAMTLRPLRNDDIELSSWLMGEAMGVSDLGKILGTLMYISSKEADVRTVYVPQKNQSRKSRQTDCTVHDVGFRIAPQLAEVRRVYEHEAKGQDGGTTGRHVAPHVRRGHWHGYWTGPRENPTGLEIKWVAPTIVNGSRGELEGTVHEVGDRDGRYTLKSTQRECGRAAEQLNGAGRSEGQVRDGKSDR